MADLTPQCTRAQSKVEASEKDKSNTAKAHKHVRACLEADETSKSYGIGGGVNWLRSRSGASAGFGLVTSSAEFRNESTVVCWGFATQMRWLAAEWRRFS